MEECTCPCSSKKGDASSLHKDPRCRERVFRLTYGTIAELKATPARGIQTKETQLVRSVQTYGSNANGCLTVEVNARLQPGPSHKGVGEHACADSLYRLA